MLIVFRRLEWIMKFSSSLRFAFIGVIASILVHFRSNRDFENEDFFDWKNVKYQTMLTPLFRLIPINAFPESIGIALSIVLPHILYHLLLKNLEFGFKLFAHLILLTNFSYLRNGDFGNATCSMYMQLISLSNLFKA